jgi:hypothetical protein
VLPDDWIEDSPNSSPGLASDSAAINVVGQVKVSLIGNVDKDVRMSTKMKTKVKLTRSKNILNLKKYFS